MDPLAALVGAFVIASWSYQLIRDTGAVLLDVDPDPVARGAAARAPGARRRCACGSALWRLGPGHLGAIVCVETASDRDSADYRRNIGAVAGFAHLTIEVERASAPPRAATRRRLKARSGAQAHDFAWRFWNRNSGGDGGIRTLDRALQPYNGLANRRLQPLGHISATPWKRGRDICPRRRPMASGEPRLDSRAPLARETLQPGSRRSPDAAPADARTSAMEQRSRCLVSPRPA